MKRTLTFLLFTAFLLITQNIYSQTNKDEAIKKGQEAITLMDNGKIEESIKLLEEARELDPESMIYPYEIAYAKYATKDYSGAVEILEKLTSHKDVTDQVYQLLGNSYDIMGQSEEALKIYNSGLKKFPNSGKIYLEIGNVYLIQKKYDMALENYEKGITVEPSFPSNYYRASKIFLASNEKVWGMIYGELFMNLERNSERTEEISKLLYDTYKKQIRTQSDTSTIAVSFSKSFSVTEKHTKMPFNGVYELILVVSLIDENSININSLDRIRSKFLEIYFKKDHNITYPNPLFDYQKKVMDAGHMEAYNHWILMMGNTDAYGKWENDNKDKWDNFLTWFTKNQIELNNSNKFDRSKY